MKDYNLTHIKTINKQKMEQDINFEQQKLLNQPSSNQRITNVRLKKEIEFLQKSNLKYQIFKTQSSTSNAKNQSFNNSSTNFEESKKSQETSYRIVIEKGQILNKNLILFIPKQYPFSEPLFSYHDEINLLDQQQSLQQSQSQPISQLMIWLPKYKILELVELIAIKIKEKDQQQTIIMKYSLGSFINKINNYHLIFLIAVLLRVIVGLGGYSGKEDWPNLGDFEAHRNWMSITVNKRIEQWYQQSEEQIWWRIDYPPIAAYLSYIFGSIYKKIQPEAMIIQYGYESPFLRTFMRLSVLVIQIIFVFPPTYLLLQHFQTSQYTIVNKYSLLLLFSILIKPDIILIDHGHFQYNSLILGLIIGAFYCLLRGNYYTCCILFTIAIHSKQMAVYYALAFLAGLIGKVFNDYKMNKAKIIREIIIFGLIVLTVSLIIWLPFLVTSSAHHVISAIFPIHRGLYQLKVQNFWCISDVIMKWENHFSKNFLMFLCFFACTIFSIPSMIAMILSSTKKTFILGFYTIAMTFFMFSYHVHEKSILLPLAIAPLLITYLGPIFVLNLILSGTLGLYHLLKEDGQSLQYFVLLIFYSIFMDSLSSITLELEKFVLQPRKNISEAQKLHQKIFSVDQSSLKFKLVKYLLYFVPIVLHFCQALIPPPQKLEYLYHLLFAFYSFCFNTYSLLICNGALVETFIEKLKGGKRQQKQY